VRAPSSRPPPSSPSLSGRPPPPPQPCGTPGGGEVTRRPPRCQPRSPAGLGAQMAVPPPLPGAGGVTCARSPPSARGAGGGGAPSRPCGGGQRCGAPLRPASRLRGTERFFAVPVSTPRPGRGLPCRGVNPAGSTQLPPEPGSQPPPPPADGAPRGLVFFPIVSLGRSLGMRMTRNRHLPVFSASAGLKLRFGWPGRKESLESP